MSDSTLEWPASRLGDLIVAKYGKGLSQAKRHGGPVPVYGSNGVVGSHDEPITKGPTIIIGRKGSSGAVNFSATPCWPIDTTYYIDDPGPFSLEFLDLLLRSLELEQLDRSTAIPGLNRDDLYAIQVPVPPATAQDELVRLLSATRRIGTTAADHLAQAHRAIKRFSYATLAAACSGRLTTDVRHVDDSPVHQILMSHAESSDLPINKRRTKPAFGLAIPDQSDRFPSTWAYLRVRELVELRAILDVQDGNHGELYPRKTDFGEEGLPFISAESVWDRVEIETAPKLRPDVAAGLRKGFGQPRDVILTHNATVGRVALLPRDTPPVVLSTSTTYYRVDERVLLPEYLLLFMRSPFFQEQLAAVMSQTTRNQVPVTKQVELAIAIPRPTEQSVIVERTGRMLARAQTLTTRVEVAARRVDQISQAVLAKAFRGELITAGSEAGQEGPARCA